MRIHVWLLVLLSCCSLWQLLVCSAIASASHLGPAERPRAGAQTFTNNADEPVELLTSDEDEEEEVRPTGAGALGSRSGRGAAAGATGPRRTGRLTHKSTAELLKVQGPASIMHHADFAPAILNSDVVKMCLDMTVQAKVSDVIINYGISGLIILVNTNRITGLR